MSMTPDEFRASAAGHAAARAGNLAMAWKIDEIIRRATKAANQAVFEAAGVGAEFAQELVSQKTGEPSAPGEPPAFQRGNLAASISFAHPDALGTPLHAAFGVGGVASKYAKRLETGGRLTSSGKMLTVPCNDKARAMLKSLGGASLRTKNLKPLKREGQPTLLVEMTASGKKQKANGAVFVLRKSVYIHARPYLQPAKNRAAIPMAAQFRDTFKREFAMGGA